MYVIIIYNLWCTVQHCLEERCEALLIEHMSINICGVI